MQRNTRNMDPVVTVTAGIPFYNAGKYLADAIRSIINQSFTDWELILVDDGSTDDSLRIASGFTDPRIRVIRDPVNRGISFRLNQIISEAKGQYIARMDADDIAFPERLAEQVRMFENDPTLDIVDSEAVIINEGNEVIGSRAIKHDFASVRQAFKSARFIHAAVMYKKHFIEKFRYDSAFDGAEDQELWVRSFNEAKVGKIHRPLYFIRESGRLNMKAYRFRSSQLIRILNRHRQRISTPFYCLLIARIRMKECIYAVSHGLHMDPFLLKRRNLILRKEEQAHYAQQLRHAIREG